MNRLKINECHYLQTTDFGYNPLYHGQLPNSDLGQWFLNCNEDASYSPVQNTEGDHNHNLNATDKWHKER